MEDLPALMISRCLLGLGLAAGSLSSGGNDFSAASLRLAFKPKT